MSKPVPVVLTETQRSEMLDKIVLAYVRDGYRLASRTPTTAQLVKPKRFSCLLFLVLSLVILLPGLLYVLWFAVSKDKSVFLEVNPDGSIRRVRG